MSIDIDTLVPERHLIDLESHSQGDFGVDDLSLNFVYDDILLVEFIDVTDDGGSIVRNGLHIPVNTATKAWRKGVVVLAGPKCKWTEAGDIVTFPNDKGLRISRMNVVVDDKERVVDQGVFLNEDRCFGKCKAVNEGLPTTA